VKGKEFFEGIIESHLLVHDKGLSQRKITTHRLCSNVYEMHNVYRKVVWIIIILSNISDMVLHSFSIYPDILDLTFIHY